MNNLLNMIIKKSFNLSSRPSVTMTNGRTSTALTSATASSSTSDEDQKVPTLVFNHQSSSPNLAEFDSDNEDPANQVNNDKKTQAKSKSWKQRANFENCVNIYCLSSLFYIFNSRTVMPTMICMSTLTRDSVTHRRGMITKPICQNRFIRFVHAEVIYIGCEAFIVRVSPN